MSLSTTEQDLWRRCKSGDDEAREELVVSYRRLVFWLAAKFNVAASVRQDLIQEGMLALINSVDRFEPARGLKFSTFAWYRIRGQMLNMIDRGEGKAPVPVSDEILEAWAPPSELFEDENEEIIAVESGISRLPRRESEIISAIFMEGKDPKQLAKELGFDVSHIYRLRRSGLARLRELCATK